MATDLTIGLMNRPGTLAQASDALARAGLNIEGAFGYVADSGMGVYHILVSDTERASRALIDAGFDILEARPVVLVPVDNVPGEAARMLRRIADAGVYIDLLYVSVDGRMVLGGDDPHALQAALG